MHYNKRRTKNNKQENQFRNNTTWQKTFDLSEIPSDWNEIMECTIYTEMTLQKAED